MGGGGGGRKGGRRGISTAKTRRAARMAAKQGIGTGVRAAFNRGERGFSAFGGSYSGGNVGVVGTDAYNAATPAERAAAQENMRNWESYQAGTLSKSQIPGTAEYAQRIRKEEAKEKTTKAESGFADTFKKAMAITGFVAAPGIFSGANLINTLKKKDTDYSKAFAPQSIADKYGAWSPQNLSRFGAETTDSGDWNMAGNYPSSADQKTLREAFNLNPTKENQQKIMDRYGLFFSLPIKKVEAAPSSFDIAGISGPEAKTLMGIIANPATPKYMKDNAIKTMQQEAPKTLQKNFPGLGLVQNNQWSPGNLGGEIGQIASAGTYGLGIGQNEVGQVTRSNDPIAQENRNILNQISNRLASSDTPGMDKLNRSWNRGLGTDTRAVRSATVRSRGGGARPLPTLASQAPALKAAQDQQAQAGNLTIADYLKQSQEQSAQSRAALSQLQTGRTDLSAQIEALKKQYGEDVDLTGLQKQSGEFQTAIDQRTADLSAYDQAVRGNVVRQQQMWATPQRTWGVKARTSEYKSPLQQFGRKARQETKKIQTKTPTISNLAATWGNLPVLNV